MKASHRIALVLSFTTCTTTAMLAGCSSSTGDKSNLAGAAGKAGGSAGRSNAGSAGAAAGASSSESSNAGAAGRNSGSGAAGAAGNAGVAGSAGVTGMVGVAGIAGSAGAAGAAGATGVKPSLTSMSLTVDSLVVRGSLPQGTDPTVLSIGVNIAREGSQDGTVDLTLVGLPPGTSYAPQTVAPGGTSAFIQVKIASTALPGGPYSVQLVATPTADPSLAKTLPVSLYVAQRPGSLDSSFGVGGILTLKAVPQGADAIVPSDSVRAFILDELSRMFIAGTSTTASGNRGWLMRLLPDGNLDPAFGKAGKLTEFGQSSSVDHIALAGERSYVAVSATSGVGSGPIWYVRRLLDSGANDPVFLDVKENAPITAMMRFKEGLLVAPGAPSLITSAGELDTKFTAPYTIKSVRQFALDKSSDKALVAIYGPSGAFQIARLMSDGSDDPSWGKGDGVVITCPTEYGLASSLAYVGYQPSNGVYPVFATCVSGPFSASGDASLYFALSNGDLDPKLGANGKLLLANPGQAIAAAMQSDSKILLLYATEALDLRGNPVLTPLLKRVQSDGKDDATFGELGVFAVKNAMSSALPTRMVYDAKAQRVVLVGDDTASGGLRLVRIWL